MNNLSVNLTRLRCNKSLSQKDVAKYLNITTSAYGFYEQGKRTPSIDVLRSLSSFYGVSIDSLMNTEYSYNEETLGSKLKKLREDRNLTLEDIATYLNTTNVTISRYENDKREPNGESLKSLAMYYNVSTDYLLGINTSSPTPNRFNLILKKLRKDNGLTQFELANILNIDNSSISKYENGKAIPDHKILCEISSFFNVSIDYLFGRSETNREITFGNRIESLRLEHSLSQNELASIINVSKGAVSNWENNNRFPDKDMLCKIADFFKVSTDYLLDRTPADNDNKNISFVNNEIENKIYNFIEVMYSDIINRFNNLDNKISSMDNRLDSIDTRLDSLEKYVVKNELKITELHSIVDSILDTLKLIK